MDDQGTKRRTKIAEICNRLSKVHERYRQTVRQMDWRQQMRSLKIVKQQYVLHMSSQYGELRRTSG